jgi:hypothetical protein
MSTSNNNIIPAPKPLFTREYLHDIETELAKDGETVELRNIDGKVQKIPNCCRGAGLRDVEAGGQAIRNIVRFQGERAFKRRELLGRADGFLPVYPMPARFHGANRTYAEAKKRFVKIAEAFEASGEAQAMAEMIRTELKGCAVDKVMSFGLGTIGRVCPELSHEYAYWEHAAARVIARAVREVSSAPTVALLAQDPSYTDVCKKVLAEFDFQVIEGYGAKGFALVDDNSVVLAHHPNFPLREIIADLARPALITMKAQHPEKEPLDFDQSFFADTDSMRSRIMMREYRRVFLAGTRQEVFHKNAWYVKKTNPPEAR